MTSPAYQISIPHPCTQSWEQMTPSGNGRHCMACDKVVTDFTGMSDRQVQDFFLEHQGEAVCGRFRKVQLDRIRIQVPSYILSKPIPLWKKFLVVLLICFGSSVFAIDVAVGNHFQPPSAMVSGKEKTQKKGPGKAKKKKRLLKKDLISLENVPTGITYGLVMTGKESQPDYSFLLSPRALPLALLAVTEKNNHTIQ